MIPQKKERWTKSRLQHALYKDGNGEPLTEEEVKRVNRFKWSLEGAMFSARRHLGKWVDNDGPNKLLEGLSHDPGLGGTPRWIQAALAFFGFRAVSPSVNTFDDVVKGLGGAVLANISMKLATTQGGTPPVSQIAGLAGLGAVGALNVGPAGGLTTAQQQLVQLQGFFQWLQSQIPPANPGPVIPPFGGGVK